MSRPSLAVAAFAVLAGCSNEPAEIQSTLAVSPAQIEITETATEGSIFLTTTPSGGRLDWQVAGKPDWLVVEPTNGVVTGVAEVKLRAPSLLNGNPGSTSGILDIVSDGGSGRVQVTVLVLPNPIVTVSPASLAIPETRDTASFAVTNTGTGSLEWTVLEPPAYLTVVPTSGSLPAGLTVHVRVTAQKGPLPAGVTSANLTLRSNQRAGDVVVPVSIAVAPAPTMVPSAARLAFPLGTNTQPLGIQNAGKGTLTWAVGQRPSWLAVAPSQGELQPGESAQLSVSIARAQVPGGAAEGIFELTNNSAQGTTTIPVRVVNTPPVASGVMVLDHRVVDAEFSPATDLLVTVSANPSRINIIDTRTGEVRSIALSSPPTAVSIDPLGTRAAVGHDAFVTLVNLLTATVLQVYPVTADVLDVVLAPGWAYVFPRRDQWTSIFSIELATGTQVDNSGVIYAGTLAKLHPSGQFMYGANNGLSPSDIEKYDVRNGAAVRMYDSPYHGDYAFNGDLWISEDGTRIFVRSGNVFRSSPVPSEDMRYAGKLAGTAAARWVVDSRAANRIFALAPTDPFNPQGRIGEVRVYDPAFLAFLGTAPLLPIPAGTTTASPDGRFVFVSADGRAMYVLVQADPAAGLLHDWALETFGIVELP